MRNPLKPHVHSTFAAAMIWWLKGVAKGVLVLGVVFLSIHWLTGSQGDIANLDRGDGSAIMQNREPAKGTPQYVLDQHMSDCWVGSQTPKAELPGAAIVQFNDGHTIYTTKHSLVDAAFNEALHNIGFKTAASDKINVVALCK